MEERRGEKHHVYQYFLQDAKRPVVTLDKNFIAETFVGQLYCPMSIQHPTQWQWQWLIMEPSIYRKYKIIVDLSETFFIFCYRYIQPNYPRGFSFIIKI